MPRLKDLSEQQALLALLRARQERIKSDQLGHYRPYPKQRLFHAAGRSYKERLLRAGNQNGKTYAGGMEVAYHLTGNYPDWWEGRTWDRPIMSWASSDTGETTRDNPQRALLGLVGEFGTGAIPKRLIGAKKSALGVADLLDYVKIKHRTGGWSTLRFKYYAQGRQKWQGPPIDLIWYDEEPPPDIYSEGSARLIATRGMEFTTFTPLLGMSEVVRMFLKDESAIRHDTNMTIEDAEHIAPEERQAIIDAFPAHEREARAQGIPTLGSGRIFPISEEDLKFDLGSTTMLETWVYIGGLDFGWDHPTAAVKLAWDRDSDIVYITQAYRRREATPLIHCGALRPWGTWLPWAWPHDGYQHDKGGSGQELRSQYEGHGLSMLDSHATFENGGNGVEAGLMEMLDRMQTGRLKVAQHLVEWFDEFRLYHRDNGKVVKEYDDLMSATRYALMMLRYAEPEGGDQYDDDDSDYSGSGSNSEGWMR